MRRQHPLNVSGSLDTLVKVSKFGKKAQAIMDKDPDFWQSEMDKFKKGNKSIGDFPDKNNWSNFISNVNGIKLMMPLGMRTYVRTPTFLRSREPSRQSPLLSQRGDYNRAEQLSTYLESLRQNYSY